MIRVGCAGWSLSSAHADLVGRVEGSMLERYATLFDAVEINSSFYRPHQPKTYRRWADAVPDSFSFAVKVPRTITHEARLKGETARATLARFLDECRELGGKLGPLLVQLPPNLVFDPAVASAFFTDLVQRHQGPVVCEPRHPTWFGQEAENLLKQCGVARVVADPAVAHGQHAGGGAPTTVYARLHGQPKMYYSRYPDETLAAFAQQLLQAPRAGELWCILDNTAAGHAVWNALTMKALLRQSPARPTHGSRASPRKGPSLAM